MPGRLDPFMKFLENLTVYQDFAPRSAAINMAIDEALLEAAKIPSIRFYRWNSPALSFGYFGKFTDVADYAVERDLVRRWTGGGIVFHGDDLTYSIIIPAASEFSSASSKSIYAVIHAALCDTLIAGGARAELAQNQSPKLSEVCFANPVRADIMLNGRKVAGAAQRRTRAGLLHQGSIQYVDLGNGLAERFASELSANCSEKKIDNDLLDRAKEIAQAKYGMEGWLRRR
jgi:lipoyl(octanoyl) transferase